MVRKYFTIYSRFLEYNLFEEKESGKYKERIKKRKLQYEDNKIRLGFSSGGCLIDIPDNTNSSGGCLIDIPDNTNSSKCLIDIPDEYKFIRWMFDRYT